MEKTAILQQHVRPIVCDTYKMAEINFINSGAVSYTHLTLPTNREV